jgi:phosphocarrier protein
MSDELAEGLVRETLLTIVNERGLHARAAARLVKLAGDFESQIQVKRGDMMVNGRSIMGLLLLGAGQGAEITVTATGEDAVQALASVIELVSSGFGEL